MKENNINKGFLEFVYDFYTGMKAHEVTLAYEGEINHQIIKVFTSVTEEKLSGNSEAELVQKRVYHVMVECLQNITKHAADRKGKREKTHRGILMVSRNQFEYRITTGNLIENSKIEQVRELIEFINSKDKNELSELYKKQIKEGNISDKGGAVLGFIDIKRKTGKKLEYQFLSVSEDSSFFLFTSTIPRISKT